MINIKHFLNGNITLQNTVTNQETATHILERAAGSERNITMFIVSPNKLVDVPNFRMYEVLPLEVRRFNRGKMIRLRPIALSMLDIKLLTTN